jgi:hypothetical protein
MPSESAAVADPVSGTGGGAALPAGLADEIRRRVLEEPGLVRLTQVSRSGGRSCRISLRPVMLRGERLWQEERVREGRTAVRNLDAAAAAKALQRLLDERGARELHLVTAAGDLHARGTRKGRLLVSRSRPQERDVAAAPAHDRAKEQPLDAFDSSAFLRVTGLAGGDNRVRASMRGKWTQVNEFLRVVANLVGDATPEPLDIVDCGCGRAYLSLATYLYLAQVRGCRVRLRGIDRNPETIAACNRMAQDLGVDEYVRFAAGDVATCTPDIRPRLVLSLHACDTATDEALGRGVGWGSEWLLCAPCCQHDVQRQMPPYTGPLRGLLRHGILRERLADLLADTFRAQILRILGYRVRVVEFVSPDATARNLLLRAESGIQPGQPEAVAEYLALRDHWAVTPPLERLLSERLSRHLAPAGAPAPPAPPGSGS